VSFGVPRESGFEHDCEEEDFEVQVEPGTVITVRMYRSKSAGTDRRPAHVSFHGGGKLVRDC